MKSTYSPLNFVYDDNTDLLREQVNSFSVREIAPLAQSIDRSNDFQDHLWSKLGDTGLLGVTTSEEFGGANMGYLAHVIAMEEISRASASVALSYSAHSNLCVNHLLQEDPN